MDHIANGKCKSALLTLVVLLLVIAETAFGQATAFSYQGRLTDASNPANGSFDMQFKLFSTPDVGTGTQQGPTVTNSTVQVTNGVFSVQLDFGNVFDGSARFLEISLRPAGSPNARTVLSPRQPLTSTPYAVRSATTATADTATNTTQLGGLPPTRFVQVNPAGNVGIGTANPTSKLEIAAQDGLAITGFQPYMTLRDTNTNLRSILAGGNGDFGLYPNSFIGGSPAVIIKNNTGNVGIGAANPTSKLEIAAQDGLAITGFQPFMTLRDTNAGGARSILAGGNGDFGFYPASFIGGVPAVIIKNNTGNVGIGAVSPNTRLTLGGGSTWTTAGWTASMNMQNASALGWEANASGQRFGIGQTNNGLFFFRTNSAFGNTSSPANYDLSINDAGNVGVTGNVTQGRDKGGFVKAMVMVASTGALRSCYNGLTGVSFAGDGGNSGCGFTVTHFANGGYGINFGFKVEDRFVMVTVEGVGITNRGANYSSLNTTVNVRTFITGVEDSTQDSYFAIVVF